MESHNSFEGEVRFLLPSAWRAIDLTDSRSLKSRVAEYMNERLRDRDVPRQIRRDMQHRVLDECRRGGAVGGKLWATLDISDASGSVAAEVLITQVPVSASAAKDVSLKDVFDGFDGWDRIIGKCVRGFRHVTVENTDASSVLDLKEQTTAPIIVTQMVVVYRMEVETAGLFQFTFISPNLPLMPVLVKVFDAIVKATSVVAAHRGDSGE